jgi:hypothetical protein
VDVEHTGTAKMFEEKVNFLLKGSVERQPTKKITIVYGGSISKFFFMLKIPSKERTCH